MGSLVRIGAALGLAALVAGCSSIVDHKGFIADEVLVQSVQPGIDNRASVERTLGRERGFLEDLFGNIGQVGAAGMGGGGAAGP